MDIGIYSPSVEALRAAAAEVIQIDDIEIMRRGDQAAPRFRGRLLLDAQLAYDQVSPRFRELGYTALLLQDGRRTALQAMPGLITTVPSRLWLAVLLFVLTVASTIYVGGQTSDPASGLPVFNLGYGLAFSASLLSILLTHELGHYIAARRLGVAVSYPFFIPMPFAIGFLGTMGAFISIKEPVPNRRALLAIGAAGPLAGLVVAIPVLMLGLSLSQIQLLPPPGSGQQYLIEGNSLLYAGMKILTFGRFLPGGGEDVFLHPVAWAGWAGLLVTGLNLIPAGQLDGGHIFFALFGPRAAQIMNMVAAAALLAMGFLWSGWFLWAIIVALLGQQRSPLLNEISPLSTGWKALAIVGLLAFVLVFVPVPLTVITP